VIAAKGGETGKKVNTNKREGESVPPSRPLVLGNVIGYFLEVIGRNNEGGTTPGI